MKEENIINFDFQGWPIKKMPLKEILERLGIYDYKIQDEKLLDTCPLLLTDDGMGYGVSEAYITEVNVAGDKIIMFRDAVLKGVEKFVDLKTFPGDVIKYKGKEFSVVRVNDEGNFVLYELNTDKLIDAKGEQHEMVVLTPEELNKLLPF